MARLYFILHLLCLLALSIPGFAQHYTVMVSLDGFRDDYTRAYNTPFLDQMAQQGVSSTMMPSFPSKTFPNHYTLATGLVPDHHGIIANTFYDEKSRLTFSLGNAITRQDPRFWCGEPIWNTAARQSVRVGVVYWPGSDVKIGGRFPDLYHDYSHKPLLSYAERIAEVARYLRLPKEQRPQLVMAYFEEPDHSGHVFGPFSPETRNAVERMDQAMSELYATLRTLPFCDSINLIVLSDHGMASISPERVVNPYDYIKPEWVKRIRIDLPTLIWPRKGYADKVYKALQQMPHTRVWYKNQIPAYLNYGSNANVAPIVLNPDTGWIISEKAPRNKGTHGFDSTDSDMYVPFRAIGPDFKKGYRKPQVFTNVNIYPLICHLLGITPAPCDGQLDTVNDLLK